MSEILTDTQALDLALRYARRGQGQTSDNPSVGCLIQDSRGWTLGLAHTAAGGRPHAEVAALAQAGASARGGTAFITLEPCVHQGRSGPCTTALISAGIARVVIGTLDANPSVAGQGAAALEAAGVEVSVLGDAACIRHHLGFNRSMLGGRPYVLMKIATTQDGAMTYEGADRQVKITGPEVQRQVHLTRAQSDFIITGRGTMAVDQPRFTVRLPGYVGAQPRLKVWQRGDRLEDICANQIMVEAGPTLSSALFDQIDELHWYRSSESFGTQGIRPDFLTTDPQAFGVTWPQFTCVERRSLGQDMREIWRR